MLLLLLHVSRISRSYLSRLTLLLAWSIPGLCWHLSAQGFPSGGSQTSVIAGVLVSLLRAKTGWWSPSIAQRLRSSLLFENGMISRVLAINVLKQRACPAFLTSVNKYSLESVMYRVAVACGAQPDQAEVAFEYQWLSMFPDPAFPWLLRRRCKRIAIEICADDGYATLTTSRELRLYGARCRWTFASSGHCKIVCFSLAKPTMVIC